MSGVIRRRQMRGSVENVDPATLPNKYLTFYAREAGTFSFNNTGLEYSLNGKSWKSLEANTPSVVVPAGSYIYFRGNLTSNPNSGIGTFSSSGMFDVLGNINSLIYEEEAEENITIRDYRQYGKLFKNCSYLVHATDLKLPKRGLSGMCYNAMFSGCSNLISAPRLEATTLAEGCYLEMFYNCTSLTPAPELPSTTLAGNCYKGMFRNCTSLVIAPELPATTLKEGCYQGMFAGCTSLAAAPVLPATTLARNCYSGMFQSCSSLNYIKAMFTTTPSYSYTSSWVSGVASSGTFVKNTAATWTTTGINGVPSGWIVQTANA